MISRVCFQREEVDAITISDESHSTVVVYAEELDKESDSDIFRLPSEATQVSSEIKVQNWLSGIPATMEEEKQPWADPPTPTRTAFVASAPSSPQPGPSGWRPQSPKEKKPADNSDRFPCGASVGDAQCPCDVCMGTDVNCQPEEHVVFTDPPASPSAASTVCFCRQCQLKVHKSKCWMYNSVGWCDCSMSNH